MFEFEDTSSPALIKVFGIGGGGCNAVEYMLEQGVKGVEFVCANTDLQVLEKSQARTLQLGESVTQGLGAGADPEKGREATLESREQILQELKGVHMVFIAAGMGGGTGTGGAPVVAEIAKEQGILSVAVITRPFEFEGQARQAVAEQGISAMSENVDSLIIIANERLRELAGDDISILNAFAQANEVLYGSVRGIAELITVKGYINVDFADVQAIMTSAGTAIMGSGFAKGEGSADEAVEAAIHSPLLDNEGLGQARGVLTNVTAGHGFRIAKYGTIQDRVKEIASQDAKVICGLVLDDDMADDEVRVTVVAAGLSRPVIQQPVIPLSNPEKTSTAAGRPSAPKLVPGEENYDELEIPTFLRRQAD